MQSNKSRQKTSLMLFLGIILLFSAVGMVAANTAFMVTDQIYSGVTVGDIDVGGLSVEAAEQKIGASMRERLAQEPLQISYQQQVWKVQAAELELAADVQALARRAYDVGRSGNVFVYLQERYVAVNHGFKVPLTWTYNKEKLAAIVNDIAATINRKPQNATLVRQGSHVERIAEVNGRTVEVDKLLADIDNQLRETIPVHIALPVSEQIPSVVIADLADINSVIAVYTTEFNPTNANRVQNVRLAANSVNNVLVRAGETFSFNDRVGLRLEKYGYKEAPGFVNGKLVPDFGGGVCQVSSTIYNAVLLADMTITERTSHYRPPNYVPLGQDATVADNQLDFKFTNNTGHNIYITNEMGGRQLTVYIWGKEGVTPDISIVPAERKVIEPNTIVKQDPELEAGKEVVEDEGQKGFQISIYRVKTVNGKEVSRNRVSYDDFPPEDRIIRVGIKNVKEQK